MLNLFLKYGKHISPLEKYKKNIYSQNGEDGVLKQLISVALDKDISSLWVCEFGAWDGKHMSNTFSLVERGARAVYIEGDKEKYQDLLQTCSMHQSITPILEFISSDSSHKNSLKNILSRTKIPQNFDILSIDIDSYDLDIWESFDFYLPSIVVIEINSATPVGVRLRHSDDHTGNSFSSTLDVAHKKGYKLVCHIGNLIFVRPELYEKLGYPDEFSNNEELLFNDFWQNVNPFLSFLDWSTSFVEKHFIRIKKTLIVFTKTSLIQWKRNRH